MHFWLKKKLRVKSNVNFHFQKTWNVTDGRGWQKILSWVLAWCIIRVNFTPGRKKPSIFLGSWLIKKIAHCSYSTARDARVRFKAGGLRGTLPERQRCKGQDNSNLLHDCAIYLFIQHRITFIPLLLLDRNTYLCHPCNFTKKSNSSPVLSVLLKYSADTDYKA